MASKTGLFQFTQTELDGYIKDDNSCVRCVPSKMHIGFPPYGLENFKETLLNIISKKKIGIYDDESKGIVLDVRKIQLEGTMSMIRQDSPELHLNIQANFYVFQPHVGALLKGTVKFISKRHVSALIYNVFNVSIRLSGDFKRKLQVNKEISFRVKKFDLENVLPYIEGELTAVANEDNGDSGIDGDKAAGKPLNKKISFAASSSEDSSSDDDSENEKMFKSLVVKTETSLSTKRAAEDSSEDSDSSEEDDEPALPAPVKQEPVKKEAHKSTSSSEESSDDDMPPKRATTVPPVSVKRDKDASSSSDDDDSSEDDEQANKSKVDTSEQIRSLLAAAALKREQPSDSSSDSSDEEEEEPFKVPMPVVKEEPAMVKREVTPPSKRIRNDSSSSTSGAEGKSPSAARRKIMQSPVPVKVEPPSATKNPTKPTKEKPAKKRTTSKNGDLSSQIEDVVAKVAQRLSDASDQDTPKKTAKATKPSPKKKLQPPAPVDSSSSSSDSDGDQEKSGQLNTSINDILSQVYASKLNQKTAAASATEKKAKAPAKPKPDRKRKSSTGEAEKAAASKAKTVKGKKGDLFKYFAADALSSTRLDANASPLPPKPKKKKATKE